MNEDDAENAASQEMVVHEIDEIGAVRARAGTSTAELAGAASYWNKEAKRLKALVDGDNKKAWREGFLTSIVAIATIQGLILAYLRLL